MTSSICMVNRRMFGVTPCVRMQRRYKQRYTPMNHRKFRDRVRLEVYGGDGGSGCSSFDMFDFKKVPDGGNGGFGGSVYLRVNTKMDQFEFTTLHFRAANGGRGGARQREGKNAEDVYIAVPPGTLVREIIAREVDTGARILREMADLSAEGAQLLVAKGGCGGGGNRSFRRGGHGRATRFSSVGDPGEVRSLLIELKCIADVGLVGFPNAGKSSLLRRVSSATPRVASYPFTTLNPSLGVVIPGNIEGNDDAPLTIADIPGIIDGAHANRGLGHHFLRHIERTKLLLFVVDVSSSDGRDPVDDYRTLCEELRLYSPELAEYPRVVFANKCDVDATDARMHVQRLRAIEPGPVVAGSALQARNLDTLMQVCRTLIQRQQQQQQQQDDDDDDDDGDERMTMAATRRMSSTGLA